MIEQISSFYKINYARKAVMTLCGCMEDKCSTQKCKHSTDPDGICKDVRYDQYCSNLTAYEDLYNIVKKTTTTI
jgi:hypothetical protein